MRACSIIESQIIQTLADKGLLARNLDAVSFLIDMYSAKRGITDMNSFLKDYRGTTNEKIESFIEDIQTNPKIQGASYNLSVFKKSLEISDDFNSIVNENYDYNKTLVENLEALLDKYYSFTMGDMSFDKILTEVNNVKNIEYNTAQKEALNKINNFTRKYLQSGISYEPNDYFTLIGKAGTGKTTIACQAIYDYIKDFYAKNHKLPSIIGAAVSHKAKSVLKNSLSSLYRLYESRKMEGFDDGDNLDFMSTAQMLSASIQDSVSDNLNLNIESSIDLNPKFDPPISSADVILVDECSMLTPLEFAAIVKLRKMGSVLIFMGDSGQVRPIVSEESNRFKDEWDAYNLCINEDYTNAPISEPLTANQNSELANVKSLAFNVSDSNSATLTERMRSGENHPLLKFADSFWNDDYKGDVLPSTEINENGALLVTKDQDSVIRETADLFEEGIKNGDSEKIVYVCYTNRERNEFANKIHNKMLERLNKKNEKESKFFVGEPVYMNASQGDVKNGTRGVIVDISEPEQAFGLHVYEEPKSEKLQNAKTKERAGDLIKTTFDFFYNTITIKDSDGNLHKVKCLSNVDVKDNNGNVFSNESAFNAAIKEGTSRWEFTDINGKEIDAPPTGLGSTPFDPNSKYGMFIKMLNRKYPYSFNAQLEYGYAMTVHKSQGSTFETVIVDYTGLKNHKNDLNYQNLVYTGVTRAKNTAIIIDDKYNYSLLNDKQKYKVKDGSDNITLNSVNEVVSYINRHRKYSKNDTVNNGYNLENLDFLHNEKAVSESSEKNPWFRTVEDYFSDIKKKLEKNNASVGIIDSLFLDKMINAVKEFSKTGVITGKFQDTEGATGLFDVTTGSEYVLPINNYSGIESIHTALHEFLHLLSYYAEIIDYAPDDLKNDKFKNIREAKAKLKIAFETYSSLLDRAIKEHPGSYDKKKIEYSTTNLSEFIAELSNGEVIATIKSLDKEYHSDVLSLIKDAINKFIEFIKNIFTKESRATRNYISRNDYTGLMDLIQDAINQLFDNADSELYKFARAVSSTQASNMRILKSSDEYELKQNNTAYNEFLNAKFEEGIGDTIVANGKNLLFVSALDFIKKFGDFSKDINAFNSKIKGTIIPIGGEEYGYINNIRLANEKSRFNKKDLCILDVTPIKKNTLNKINATYQKDSKTFKINTEKPFSTIDKSEMFLDYKKKAYDDKIKTDSEKGKDIIKSFKKQFLEPEDDLDNYSVYAKYPHVSDDLWEKIEDSFYDNDITLTDEDYSEFYRQATQERGNIPNFYDKKISPDERNTVFVFGSNPEGRHGAGAAKVAKEQFGAKLGQGEGLQGNSYALPTKDLRIKENESLRSISPEQIIESIKKMYEVANQNPDKHFKIAYTNGLNEATLNGYTGEEMISIFKAAGDIPSNVIFSSVWVANWERVAPYKVKNEDNGTLDFSNKEVYYTNNANFKDSENKYHIIRLHDLYKDSNGSYYFNNEVGKIKRNVYDILKKAYDSNKPVLIINAGSTDEKEKYPYSDNNGKIIDSAIEAFKEYIEKYKIKALKLDKSFSNNILNGYTIHSGGAKGTDSYFAEKAREYGADYNGYYIQHSRGDFANPPEGNIKVQIVSTKEELEKLPKDVTGVLEEDVQKWLSLAEESLGRNLDNLKKNNPDKYNLIRRDYVQMIKSDKIIVVGKLLPNGTVDGGTGWAVEMARLRNIFGESNVPIYVYNTIDNKWYKCDKDSSYGYYFFESSIPTLTKNTAGIGTEGILYDGSINNYDTDITDEQKNAIDKVFKKTALLEISENEWQSYMSKGEIDELFEKEDAPDITRKQTKTNYADNSVEVTENLLGAKEFTIRRLNSQELKIETDAPSGNFSISKSHNELYNTFMDIKVGDLIRWQSKNKLTFAPVDRVEFNDGKITIYYSGKQSVNSSGKILNTENFISENVVKKEEILNNKEIKHSIRQTLGSETYYNRVRYVNRRFRQFCNFMITTGIKEGKYDEDITVAEFLQKNGLENTKKDFLETLNHSILNPSSPDFETKKEEVVNKWAQKSVKNGQYAENEFEQALLYQRSIFDAKNNANKQIADNFETFFKDALIVFCRENDIIIDFYTAEIEKKDDSNSNEQNDDNDDTTVHDKEYETVEKWQVSESHALNSASTRLKLFLSNIPVRDTNGKIKLDDIGEPLFLSANRVYNEMQSLMSDCFELPDLLNKLNDLAKKSPVYNSINTLLTSNKNKSLQTELFILLNNEEINYENWYSNTTDGGKLKKFGLSKESTDKQSTDTYINVTKAISDGVNYLGQEKSLNTKHLPSLFKNLGEYRTFINENYVKIIEQYGIFGDKFSFANNGNVIIDVNEYLEMLNDSKNATFQNALNTLITSLHSIGMNISMEELKDNCMDTSTYDYPIVNIATSLSRFIKGFVDWLGSRRTPMNLDDYIKYSKEGRADLLDLCTICPMRNLSADKQSVVFINGNNYPKWKAISSFGSLIKHLKDPNIERRNKWIEDNFKKYSWFYNSGNYNEIKTKLLNYKTNNQNDSDIINNIVDVINQLQVSNDEYDTAKINFITKQFNNLSDNAKKDLTGNIDNPIESIIIPPSWNNDTMEKLFKDKKAAKELQRHRVVAFNKKDYFKWDADDFVLMAFESYYKHGKDSEFADFLMPIYSDAGVMEFVTLPKLDSIEKCIDSLLKSYRQELGRIALVKERARWRKDSVAAYNALVLNKGTSSLTENQKLCYDDLKTKMDSNRQIQFTDCKYYSVPIQNMEDTEDVVINEDGSIALKTKKNGAGNYLNFFSYLYNYAGQDADIQNLSLDKVREYIKQELRLETRKMIDIMSKNNYGKYNTATRQYESYAAVEANSDQYKNVFEFVCQNTCANIAITELTVTDLAQYKDAIDFQKRFKEIYAGTKRLNTTYDANTNPYAREEYTQIILKDIFDFTRNKGPFADIVNKSDLPDSQKKWLIDTYGKINLTDAQSYRSLSSLRAVMSMSGEWKKSYDKIYEKILNGKILSTKEMQIFFQPRKPFVFTHKTVDSKTSNNDLMKIGYQIKNSEFLLMYIYQNTNTLKGVNSSIIKGLNQFMEDNRIDCIHFNSGIKVGCQGAIDLDHPDLKPVLTAVERDFDTNEEYIQECRKQLKNAINKLNIGYSKDQIDNMDDKNILYLYRINFSEEQKLLQARTENMLYRLTGIKKGSKNENDSEKLDRLKSANQEFVTIIPYSEYGIISSTPEHFLDKKQKLGTQLMRLLTSDNLGEYDICGKKMKGSELFTYLSKLLTAKALLHHDKIDTTLSNDNQLLGWLLQKMQGNSKYSDATMSAIQSFDDNGHLNLLGDIVVKTQIESLINSFIREEINDVKLDGGTCIQVTSAFADDLHIKYTNDEKGNRIKYWECRMPIALKEVYDLAKDSNGVLSVDNLMKNPFIDDITKEKLLRVIGCRVPTESKHSIQHLKCVEFLPSNAGSCIMLPYEITKTSGADFDIDKLYLWRYSFDIETVEVNGIKKRIPRYVKYTDENGNMIPIHKMTEKQLNNAIIDLFWTVLENEASAVQELFPNSYDSTQKAAYIGTLFHNAQYDSRIRNEYMKNSNFRKEPYNNKNKLLFLKSMDIDKLQSWYSTGLNRCSLMNQSYFFDLNSKGKGMLGIMAVNNVFLALLQHTKVSIDNKYRVTINGNDRYKLYEPLIQKEIDGSLKKVLSSLTLAEFLAAAPDSAKDPTLVFLGINNQNVNALVSAALLNYDIQDISLMFNHPVIKELFEGVSSQQRFTPNDIAMKIIRKFTPKNDDGTYDYENTNQYLKQVLSYEATGETFKGSNNEDVAIRKVVLNQSTSKYDVTEEDLINNDNEESQIRLLLAFYKLYNIGQDLNNLAQVTRQDSTSGSTSATFAGNLSKISKIQRISLENKLGLTTLNGAGDLLNAYDIVGDDINLSDEESRKDVIDNLSEGPLGYIQTQLTLALMNTIKYGSGRFPDFSPFMKEAYRILASTSPYGYLSEDTIKLMVNDYIKYQLFSTEFFGTQIIDDKVVSLEQKMAVIINETWDDMQQLKFQYNLFDNKLIKSLTLNEYGVIVLPDAGQLLPDAKKELTDAWEDLINSPYDKVRMLGYNLIRYSFYRNGLKFAPNGFGHLCPDVRKTIPEYVDKIEESYYKDDKDEVASFVSRFIHNNAAYLSATKKKNLRPDQYTWINASIKKIKDETIDNDDFSTEVSMSYNQEVSDDIEKKYSYVVKGNSESRDKYTSLVSAQMIPMSNSSIKTLEDHKEHFKDSNDFTYYPSYNDTLDFVLRQDVLDITDPLQNVLAYKPSNNNSNNMYDSNDMYNILQELKNNNKLTLTTNLC